MKPSESLSNASISPGWTEKEIEILRKAILKFGLGNWRELFEGGYLPGKTISQLNNQVRRMLGQQSSAEFTGLHIDALQIGEINKSKTGYRKCGVLINTGDKMTRQEIEAKIEQNRALYEKPKEQWEAISLEELVVERDNLALKMRLLGQLKKELAQVEGEIRQLIATDSNAASLRGVPLDNLIAEE